MLPDAAKSNYNIFYSNGRPRTVGQVEETVSKKLENAAKVVGVNLKINKPVNEDQSTASATTTGSTATTASTATNNAVTTEPSNVSLSSVSPSSPNNGFIKTSQTATLSQSAPAAPSFTTAKPAEAVKDTNAELLNAAATTNTILKESLATQKSMLDQLVRIATNGVSNKEDPTVKEEAPVKTQRVSEDRSLTRYQSKGRTNTAVDLKRPII